MFIRKPKGNKMLCKLTNTGPSVRVLYDINTVARTILPGKSLDVDLSQREAQKYKRAQLKGQHVTIQALEEGDDIGIGEVERALDLKETFTLTSGDLRHPPEPVALKEALGKGALDDKPLEEPPALEKPANQPNPVEHAAETQAKEPVVEEAKPEPQTAAELLACLNDYSDTDKIRLATKVLVKKPPQNARTNTLTQMLAAQAKKDAETK
jgi:hypothetical protein